MNLRTVQLVGFYYKNVTMHGPLNVERQTMNVCCATGHNIQKMCVMLMKQNSVLFLLLCFISLHNMSGHVTIFMFAYITCMCSNKNYKNLLTNFKFNDLAGFNKCHR
jgi:hypothetical protein